MAQALEEMPEVVRYVKNQSIGFTIPYTLNGEEKQYYPDFVAQVDPGSGGFGSVRLQPDLLNLFVEVTDPWDAQRTIRAAVSAANVAEARAFALIANLARPTPFEVAGFQMPNARRGAECPRAGFH